MAARLKSQSAKNQLDPKKIKIGPKSDISPFAQNPSINF